MPAVLSRWVGWSRNCTAARTALRPEREVSAGGGPRRRRGPLCAGGARTPGPAPGPVLVADGVVVRRDGAVDVRAGGFGGDRGPAAAPRLRALRAARAPPWPARRPSRAARRARSRGAAARPRSPPNPPARTSTAPSHRTRTPSATSAGPGVRAPPAHNGPRRRRGPPPALTSR